MSDSSNEHRLPPPAFPPGQRRHVLRNSQAQPEEATEAVEDHDIDDGIIEPDEPMPHRLDPIEQAFISPDEPIPERVIELTPEFADYVPPSPEDGEGEVVGMDLDPYPEPLDILAASDPHVAELTGSVSRLAAALLQLGEAGLRATPQMSQFDTTLRAYCLGYLAGRRAEEPLPVDSGEDS